MVGMPRTAVTKIESGSREVRFGELESFARALGLPVGELAGERLPLREAGDGEFFRSAERPEEEGVPYMCRLETLLLALLERFAGNPGVHAGTLPRILGEADRLHLEACGRTISGVEPARLEAAVRHALGLLEEEGMIGRMPCLKRSEARWLPLRRADLSRLTAAEYLRVERALRLQLPT